MLTACKAGTQAEDAMGRRNRRRGRGGEGAATSAGRRAALVPWRERVREVLARLRDYARDGWAEPIETVLAAHFGDAAPEASVADLQLAFDDYVCAPGSAGDEAGRSIVVSFAEEEGELQLAERESLKRWPAERSRRVYLLDRAARDRLDLWDPLAGGRIVLHLVERLPAAAAAALPRGTVVVASSVPWAQRRIVLGPLEMYEDADAIEMYRREVRQGGRHWHELPPPVPAPGMS